MNSKLQRQLYGPGWAEVIFGAVLSLLLGIVLAAVCLVLKPVQAVKALPKELEPGMIYYLEGSKNASNARLTEAKLKSFVDGGSVVLTEEDLNVLTAPAAKPAPAPGGDAKAQTVTPGVVNFRIRDSVLQIGFPVQLNIQGLELNVILQARGGFEKDGDSFEFVPAEFYLGSCPLQRLPFVESMLMKRLLASAAAPAEWTDAWKRVSAVAVEESTLRLTVE